MQAYLANNAQKWKQDNIENKNHEDALKELLKCTNPRQTCAKNIMISIFFDGTGNHKERDFSKGAHTNVARLHALHNSKETEGFFSIYLQGVGTPFKEIDDDGPFDLLRGAALGRGGMRRINYAYVEIINRISRFVAGVNVVEFMKVMNEGKNNIRRHSSSTINTAYGVRSKEEFDKLKKDYGIEEDDFFTAELEVVPAGKLRDVGLDQSMIGGYGQDDRICAFTSLRALLEIEETEKTVMVYLTDKEEIGSEGSTSLKSTLPEYIVGKMLSLTEKNYNDQILRETLWNSKALSSDVTAAMNPVYKSVHDIENVARLSYGLAFAKYTGSRGKSMANDADAEFIQEIRQIFDKNEIKYQSGGFGKVDEGGGGTVAKFLAYYGIRTIDAGPALLSMHSLFEISSKADLYETYRAYKVFFELN